MFKIYFSELKLKAAAIFFASVAAAGIHAQILTTNSYSRTVNTAIPDNDPSGLASSINVSGIFGNIEGINLTLNVSGGYNGDLYAYLVNTNTGIFAVLLNRVGVQNGNDVGYGDSGFDVTFSAGVTNDIHFYQDLNYTLNGNGALTGTWGADGRNIDPGTNGAVLAAAPQTALLDSFYDTNPNGDWVLFLADLNSGSQSTLQDWQMDIISAPEPSSIAFFGILGSAAFLFLRRQAK